MFKRKDSTDKVAQISDLVNTPPTVYEDAANTFAEIYGSAKVEAARWFIVAVLSLMVVVVAIISIASILPLKEVRPWVVEISKDTGVVNRPVEVLRIDPNVLVVRAELARWVEAVYTIDPLRSKELLRWANGRVAEKANAQFTEFRGRERIFPRINEEPNLIREARVTAVDANQKGTAFVFVTTTERIGVGASDKNIVKKFRVTLNYKFSTATQEQELLANPLGLFITYFSDVEERAQK